MWDVLQIARSSFYYEKKEQTKEDELTEAIVEVFHKNRKAYGTRKIKVKLHKTACNEAQTKNVLDRQFEQTQAKRFVVSDLTYVKIENKWNYICVLIDLFNREIIGHSAGPNKDAALVSRAFARFKVIYAKCSGFILTVAASSKTKKSMTCWRLLKSAVLSA